MTSILDKLSKWSGFPDAEFDTNPAENFSHFSHKSDESGKEKSDQVADKADFPNFPTFPTNSEGVLRGDEFSSSSLPLHADPLPVERARASSSFEKKWESGKANEINDPRWEKWEKWETADLIDFYEERAAIREFDGGSDRETAQLLAIEDVIEIVTGEKASPADRDHFRHILGGAE